MMEAPSLSSTTASKACRSSRIGRMALICFPVTKRMGKWLRSQGEGRQCVYRDRRGWLRRSIGGRRSAIVPARGGLQARLVHDRHAARR